MLTCIISETSMDLLKDITRVEAALINLQSALMQETSDYEVIRI